MDDVAAAYVPMCSAGQKASPRTALDEIGGCNETGVCENDSLIYWLSRVWCASIMPASAATTGRYQRRLPAPHPLSPKRGTGHTHPSWPSHLPLGLPRRGPVAQLAAALSITIRDVRARLAP